MPEDVKLIINTLEDKGFDAYVVGGCVRDSVLGIEPNDWDICTNARPEVSTLIFQQEGYKVIPTGIKHGTVTIIVNNSHYELTTFRSDGKYSDCRRPDEVRYTNSLEEDLSRRDFTINAMTYNDKDGLIDLHGGLNDLEEKILHTVGNPDCRFTEDALRMLRAVRFATKFGLELYTDTFDSIIDNRRIIGNVSPERTREELCKILMCDDPSYGIDLLRKTGLLEHIIPELQRCVGFEQHNPNHDKDVYGHILSVLDHTPAKLEIRLAALFHDIGKPEVFSKDEDGTGHFYGHHMRSSDIARDIMTRLRFDNKTIEKVSILVHEHMSRYDFLRSKNIKKFIRRVGVDNLNDLFELQIADIKGSAKRDGIDKVLELESECVRVLNEKEPMSVKDLDINGVDLMKMGIPQGIKIGEILNNMLEIVLEDPKENTFGRLVDIAESMKD